MHWPQRSKRRSALDARLFILQVMRNTAALALAILCSACVLSVEPVVSDSLAVFDARLLGTWATESDSDRVSVARFDDKTYALEYTSDGKTDRFQARLGRLGNRMVLDAWPVLAGSGLSEAYRDMLIPAHLILVLGIGPDTVLTALIDAGALRKALAAREVALDYVSSNDRLILTGKTAELRAGLAPYIQRKGALDSAQRWRRVMTRSSPGSTPPSGAPFHQHVHIW